MIKVILKGGLGNQMFQYAAGKSLALKYDVPLYLDLSFLKVDIPFKNVSHLKGFSYREYVLDIFNIEDKRGTLFNNSFLDKYLSYVALTLSNRLPGKPWVREGKNPYKLDSSVSERGPDAILDGFWQNYGYFVGFKDEIAKLFNVDKLVDSKFKDFEENIKSTANAVSVHLRRGDYFNKKHKGIYVELNKEYYKKAIEIIKENVEDPHFFVFGGDDLDWIKSRLDLKNEKFTVVKDETSGIKNRTHFRFQALCDHNIISNSSYSWWAAYLNRNENKVVVAPDKWMPQYDFENVPSWNIVEAL